MAVIDEKEVVRLLAKRDAARKVRDFETADDLLEQLADLGVSVDDARRQRVWWVGRRTDGKGEDKGARASKNRRGWFEGGREDSGSFRDE
jgi:hypothetical protein